MDVKAQALAKFKAGSISIYALAAALGVEVVILSTLAEGTLIVGDDPGDPETTHETRCEAFFEKLRAHHHLDAVAA